MFSGKALTRQTVPKSQSKTKESAHSRSERLYPQYKDTISFLVESYLKDKKKFIKYYESERPFSSSRPKESSSNIESSDLP